MGTEESEYDYRDDLDPEIRIAQMEASYVKWEVAGSPIEGPPSEVELHLTHEELVQMVEDEIGHLFKN